MVAARPKEPRKGTVLGRFQVLNCLGSGSMATVHLARTHGSWSGTWGFDRLVSLKVLHPDLAKDSRFLQMFMHEARITSWMSHPNIVPLFEIGESDGLAYFGMEYVRAEALET